MNNQVVSVWEACSLAGRRPGSQAARQRGSREPESQRAKEPESQRASQAARQPGSQAARQPGSQAARQPTIQPSNHPTSQPANQPTSQPANQPTSQPANQPSNQEPGSYEVPGSIPPGAQEILVHVFDAYGRLVFLGVSLHSGLKLSAAVPSYFDTFHTLNDYGVCIGKTYKFLVDSFPHVCIARTDEYGCKIILFDRFGDFPLSSRKSPLEDNNVLVLNPSTFPDGDWPFRTTHDAQFPK